MSVSKQRRGALRKAAEPNLYWVSESPGEGYYRTGPLLTDEMAPVVLTVLDDLDDAEQRAERAEAELAALRERVRGLADNADRWAARPINGNAFDATVPTDDLRHLLDDDTTGASSGEGEK